MADILYVYKTSIYANLTNKCPCRCSQYSGVSRGRR